MRARKSLFLVVPLVILLAGCVPEPAPTVTPQGSSGAGSSTSAPMPTAPATPDDSAETASPAPPPAEPGYTAEALVGLCTEQTRALAPSAVYHPERATTEWLADPGVWFVVVPKELDGAPSVAVCGIGGSPSNPDVVMSGETLPGGENDMRAELIDGHEHRD